MKFRKKPLVIDAWQWPGGEQVLDDELYDALSVGNWWHPKEGGALQIKTLEGVMTASPGDWIIRGVKGEFYPCKPDIFEATYEKAEEG